MVSAKPVQSKKNIKVNSNEELADRIDKLSINKALLKGFEAGVHAVVKSSKYRCSNCNRTEHNSCKCPRKKKSNFKKSSKNKKVKKKHSTSTSLWKKKSKSHKSHKIKDAETSHLVSVPIFKKKKQSLKSSHRMNNPA
ncbi:8082_t:CDS:2 [Gigaspora rosea]|nr:8082_t:CDS:2 [Gigaspora rosea]